jgi:hypothetical protein
MSKLLTALIAAGFGFGLNAAVAQNVDSDKDKARGQDQATQQKEQAAKPSSSSQQSGQSTGSTQAAKTPQDCSKLSGKEKDKCLQATPAGTVDMSTGEGNKAKSETAKDRDREKAENPSESGIPAQSNSSVGHPNEQGTTGRGQPDALKNQTGQPDQQTGKDIPAQSKDTVGHPQERATTGEGQTLQEPGPASSNSPNENSGAKSDKQPK